MDTAVVLHSGGINSTVVTSIARQECKLALLYLDYGHRVAERERKAFDSTAQFYQIAEKQVIGLPFFKELGGNARCEARLDLEDATAAVRGHPPSFVHGLMPAMLSAAVPYARRVQAARIYLGTCERPGPPITDEQKPYPDHRREFYHRFAYMLESALPEAAQLRIELPLIDLSRQDIISLGLKLDIPFAQTWSCLRSKEKACGTCINCATRAHGFLATGAADPLVSEQEKRTHAHRRAAGVG